MENFIPNKLQREAGLKVPLRAVISKRWVLYPSKTL